jgi:adenylyl-sulfate kinase
MQRGFALWFTGMSGAGKTTLSMPATERLRALGRRVELLDGDVVRTHLSKGLGFTREDRDTNVLRIGFVAQLLARNGVVAVTAAISPYRDTRERVKQMITAEGAGFVEIYVSCPIEVLAERDVKGLYKQALAGKIDNFTGVSDPYEPPVAPDVVVDSSKETVAESLDKIFARLAALGHLEAR